MGAGWVCPARCPVSGLGFVSCSPSNSFSFFPATLNGPCVWICLCLGLYFFLCSASFLPEGTPVCSASANRGLGSHIKFFYWCFLKSLTPLPGALPTPKAMHVPLLPADSADTAVSMCLLSLCPVSRTVLGAMCEATVWSRAIVQSGATSGLPRSTSGLSWCCGNRWQGDGRGRLCAREASASWVMLLPLSGGLSLSWGPSLCLAQRR